MQCALRALPAAPRDAEARPGACRRAHGAQAVGPADARVPRGLPRQVRSRVDEGRPRGGRRGASPSWSPSRSRRSARRRGCSGGSAGAASSSRAAATRRASRCSRTIHAVATAAEVAPARRRRPRRRARRPRRRARGGSGGRGAEAAAVEAAAAAAAVAVRAAAAVEAKENKNARVHIANLRAVETMRSRTNGLSACTTAGPGAVGAGQACPEQRGRQHDRRGAVAERDATRGAEREAPHAVAVAGEREQPERSAQRSRARRSA